MYKYSDTQKLKCLDDIRKTNVEYWLILVLNEKLTGCIMIKVMGIFRREMCTRCYRRQRCLS